MYMSLHSSIIYNSPQMETTHMSNQQNKMWLIHTLEYYAAVRVNAILTHAATWMNLANIVLGERKPVTEAHVLYDSVYTK